MRKPLSLKGSFDVASSTTVNVETVVRRLENAIRRENAASVVAEEGVITFKGGPFRKVDGFNRLTQISTGKIVVKQIDRKVRVFYEVELGGALLVFALTGLTLGLVVLYFGPTLEGVIFWAFISVLTFALQYNKAVTRFPGFLRRAASSPALYEKNW